VDVGSIEPGTVLPQNTNQFTQMSSEEFLKLMLTELTSQDPLEPQDTNALLSQIQSLRQIESDVQLQSTLKDVAQQSNDTTESLAKLTQNMGDIFTQNQVASAGALIGRQVSGLNTDGEFASGKVEAVRINSEGVALQLLDGSQLFLDNLIRIQ